MKKVGKIATDCAMAVRLAIQSAPLLCLAFAIMNLFQALAPALRLQVEKGMVDAFLANDFSQGFQGLAFYLLLLLATTTLWVVVFYVAGIIQDKTEHRTITDVVGQLNKVGSVALFETETYHDTFFVLKGLGTKISMTFTSTFSFLLVAIKTISLIALLSTFGWPVPTVILLTIIPQMLFQESMVELSYSGVMSKAPEERRMRYTMELAFDEQAAKEVTFLDIRGYLLSTYTNLYDSIFRKEMAVQRGRLGKNLLLVTVSWAGTSAALVIGLLRVKAGLGTLGDIVILLGAAQQLGSSISDLVYHSGSLSDVSRYLSQLQQFNELVNEYSIDDNKPEFAEQIGTIEAKGVSFKYPGSERYVLKDIDLYVHAGQTMALVGENGAGKTTLAKLLLGLYAPTEGEILINGQNINEYSIRSIRRKMACVFQDYFHFMLNFGENVGVGDVEQIDNKERVLAAIQMAEADALLSKMPQGLDTQIGKKFGGIELSGGEWQRLAIARALMRESDFLVLDEPSAALDANIEYQMYLKFQEIAVDKTCVVISHRFSTVKMADRIIVLQDGSIIEEGTHNQLVDKNGFYATMYHKQADRYTEKTANS